LLTILARAGDEGTLTASAGGFEITLDADNRMHAVAEVHQLLERAGIFISSEGADL
jgi:glycine cleavage system regulatory protein